MSLILYAPTPEGPTKRLQKVITSLVPDANVETFFSIESLSRKLRQSYTNRLNVVILLAESPEHLSDIASVRSLFQGMSVIIILPDRNPGTVARGHLLRPRFLTYVDSDFEDVAAVLNKIL